VLRSQVMRGDPPTPPAASATGALGPGASPDPAAPPAPPAPAPPTGTTDPTSDPFAGAFDRAAPGGGSALPRGRADVRRFLRRWRASPLATMRVLRGRPEASGATTFWLGAIQVLPVPAGQTPHKPGSDPALAVGRIDRRPAGISEKPEAPRTPPEPRDEGQPEETPESPEGSCADRGSVAQADCLIERGFDPETAGETWEEAEAMAACLTEASIPTFEACCASSPDETCEEPGEPEGSTCAEVLFATFDQCMAEAGVSPDDETEHGIEVMSVCWSEVANGAFDRCCATTPDTTCEE
jgi:hypothetical protein